MKRLAVGTVIVAVFLSARSARAASCEDLAKLVLPHAAIDSAEIVAAGAFVPPPSPRRAPVDPNAEPTTPVNYKALPAFCRVKATLSPASDSDIKIEVWLPADGWNGKFQGVGNGGWAGTIGYAALGNAVKA